MKHDEKNEIGSSEIRKALGHIKTPESWKEKTLNHTESEYEPVPYVKGGLRHAAAAVCSVVLVVGIVITCYTAISRSMIDNATPVGQVISDIETDSQTEAEIEICETSIDETDETTDEYTEEYDEEPDNTVFDETLYFVSPAYTICRVPGQEDTSVPGPDDDYYSPDYSYVTVLTLTERDDWSVTYDSLGEEFGITGHVFTDVYGHRFIVSDLIYYPCAVDFDEVFDENVILRLAESCDGESECGTILVACEVGLDDGAREEIEEVLNECQPMLAHIDSIADFNPENINSRIAGAYMYYKYLEAREAMSAFEIHVGWLEGFDADSLAAKYSDSEINESSEQVIVEESESNYGSYTCVELKNGTITTYAAFREYLESIFDTKTVEEMLSRGDYIDYNGKLYAYMGDRGTNISYGNVVSYRAEMNGEDTIDFTIKVEYYEMFPDIESVEYREFTFTYSKTENGWRWSNFYIYN